MSSQQAPFNWQQFDQQMANLLLMEVSQQYHELLQQDSRQIHYLNIGNANSATIPSQRLEMYLLRTDELAARTYAVYCEVWKSQQKSLSAEFLRGICAHGIRVLISARVSSVSGEFALEETRTRGQSTEWQKAAMTSFTRNMELLFGKWTRAAEIDAKSLEYMFSATPKNPALASVASQLINARTQLRLLESRIATVEAKIGASERALSAALSQQTNTYRIKSIEQQLESQKAEKERFERERDHWQANVEISLARSTELRQQDVPDQQPLSKAQIEMTTSKGIPVDISGVPEAPGRRRVVPRLNYSSKLKRAIALQLTNAPDASDLQICRGLDADGAVELPRSWKTGENRLFERAYKDPNYRRKVEIMISKVRTDMRNIGLLG